MRRTVAAVVAVLCSSASLHAYELLTTSGGKPLRWQTNKFPVRFVINQAGSADLSVADVEEAVKVSFRTWQDVPTASITFFYGGLTAQTTMTAEGTNLVRWFESAFPFDKNSLAVTVTSFNDSTGAISDADMHMNGSSFSWAVVPTPGRFDVQSVVTHEAGHVLGLGHTDDTEATMYADAAWAETKKRTLEADDITGVTFLYPLAPGTVFPGDVNHDGRVDGIDLVELGMAFGATKKEARYRKAADFDLNGVVDGADLAVLAQTFGIRY